MPKIKQMLNIALRCIYEDGIYLFIYYIALHNAHCRKQSYVKFKYCTPINFGVLGTRQKKLKLSSVICPFAITAVSAAFTHIVPNSRV